MKTEELTWDRIMEMATLAAKENKDFSLAVDADGYVNVDINTPSRAITKAEYEYIPKEK